MPTTTTSANMNLVIPVVGSESGPQYASDINSSLTIIDQHDHSAGNGVLITPSGLNISSDLPINNNNLTAIRSSRFQAQSAVLALTSDLNCTYVTGVDLYYNDGSGNKIRITQSGAVAGTPGSIANLVSPASASYSSANQTFIWQSAANTPANMDFGYAVFRNNTANSRGLSLYPPTAMGSNYSLTLPSLPAQTNIMTLDAAGAMGAALNVDNSTLQSSTNVLSVKDLGITQAKKAIRSVATTAVPAGGVMITASCGNFGVATPSPQSVTNLSGTITTLGNPVKLMLMPDGSVTDEAVVVNNVNDTAIVQIYRDSTLIFTTHLASGSVQTELPVAAIGGLDAVAAGTYTYSVKLASANSVGVALRWTKLVAYEL